VGLLPKVDNHPQKDKTHAIKSKLPIIAIAVAVLAVLAIVYWIAQWQGPYSGRLDRDDRSIAEPRRIPTH
jgi:hypothetical protein